MFWGIPCPVLILKSSEAILLYCNIVLSFALVNGMKFVIIKATSVNNIKSFFIVHPPQH